MESASKREPDLTSTIHVASLRAIQNPVVEILEKLDPETRRIIDEIPEGSGMLIALSGPGRGARYLLDKEVTAIGRATSSDIFLDDITVSRHHAKIVRVGSVFQMEDQGSLNGTYLNGILSKVAPLTTGAELQIGKFRVHFFIGGKR